MIHLQKNQTELEQEEVEQMYKLMTSNYLGVERDPFLEDLQRKDRVLLLRSTSGDVVGFSTVRKLEVETDQETVIAIFSGDTIVSEEHRSGPGLARELGAYFQHTLETQKEKEVVWILTTKGCRTYSILPFLFQSFSPHYDQETPDKHRRIREAFGTKKYDGQYHPEENLIKHPDNPQRLRPGVADITEQRMENPHVAYFQSENPDHMEGDELVCVANVSPDNFTNWFRRLIGDDE